jgi:hypothetical protein
VNVYVLEAMMYSYVYYQILGKSSTDVVQRIKKALPRLPPVQISSDGTIMEWVSSFFFFLISQVITLICHSTELFCIGARF